LGRPTLDGLAGISYEVSDYSGEDASEAWVQGLAGALDGGLSHLQQLLTPKNYDALVALVLTDVAKREPRSPVLGFSGLLPGLWLRLWLMCPYRAGLPAC